MFKFVPLTDGVGGDSGCFAITDVVKQYLDVFLAAAALCISGMRESYILDTSQDHPWFSPENGEVKTSHGDQGQRVNPGI